MIHDDRAVSLLPRKRHFPRQLQRAGLWSPRRACCGPSTPTIPGGELVPRAPFYPRSPAGAGPPGRSEGGSQPAGACQTRSAQRCPSCHRSAHLSRRAGLRGLFHASTPASPCLFPRSRQSSCSLAPNRPAKATWEPVCNQDTRPWVGARLLPITRLNNRAAPPGTAISSARASPARALRPALTTPA